jgi:hypothetical protein
VDWDDPMQATPDLMEYLRLESQDPNLFWRVACGNHQNLLEDASARIEAVLKLHKEHCITCGVNNCKTRRTLLAHYGDISDG